MPDFVGMMQVSRARRWIDAGWWERKKMGGELFGSPPQWAIDYVLRERDAEKT